MTRPFFAATVLALLAILTFSACADDPGYFLSWQQKKNLMRLGRIQDSSGTWYDVWICPGYLPPARYAKDSFFAAGRDFHEYFEANKYHALKEGSTSCFDWALKECGLGFTVKGIPRAWGRHFSVAHERTRRRVFGWWLAYPWAFMEASVETAFRGALGAAGTAGGIASGLAVVPAYHALDSTVAGTWNLGVNTIALPAVGMAWNTVVSPPLALIGQKPSPSRVDGFWVTIVDSGNVTRERPPTPEEAAMLGQWGLVLLRETAPIQQERAELERKRAAREQEYQKTMQTFREETRREQERLRNEEQTRIREATATDPEIVALRRQQPDLQYSDLSWDAVTRYLQEKGVSSNDIRRIMDLLNTYRALWTERPKTDPVRRGVEVIGESAQDVLNEAVP